MPRSRRDFLKQSTLFAFAVTQAPTLPATAARARTPYRVFNPSQVRVLEGLGEALVPGSKKAGLAHFIDIQLSSPPADSLLMIKYLGVNPPYTAFYQSGLEAAARHPDVPALLQAMAKDAIPGWTGPPAPLFYFVLRNDAVDVVYGTIKGYESLGVPYMAHIPPPPGWGA